MQGGHRQSTIMPCETPGVASRAGLSRRAFCVALASVGGMPLMRSAHAESGLLREFPDDLFGIAAFDEGRLVATGYYGTIKVSDDAGLSWRRIDGGTTELLRRVVAFEGGTALAVGHQGSILRSTDHGRTWQAVHREPGLYLRALSFTSPAVGWAVGHEGRILHTRDAGRTWARQAIADYKGRDLPRLSGVAALDENRAVAVGEFGVVAETDDGGANWRLISYRAYPTLTDVAIRDGRGLIVGLNGTLLAVLDAGDSMSLQPLELGHHRHLLAAAAGPSGRMLAAGHGVLSEVDGHQARPVDVTPEFDLPHGWIGGLLCLGDGAAFAVGQGGAVLRADGRDAPFSLRRQNQQAATAGSAGETIR